MKSRFALTLMLLSGLLMSGTGATLAVTGNSGDGSAAVSQYDPPGDPEVLGDNESSDDEIQAADQIAAGNGDGDSLPFTGFVVIPLLIGGVALTGLGGAMQYRLRKER